MLEYFDLKGNIRMNLENIKNNFNKLLEFEQESDNRWNVISPFFRVDGSMLDLFLIKKNNKFYLSDDGYALTNLNCLVDVESKDCVEIRKELCVLFDVKELKDGTFEKQVDEENFYFALSQFASFISHIENLVIFFN